MDKPVRGRIRLQLLHALTEGGVYATLKLREGRDGDTVE